MTRIKIENGTVHEVEGLSELGNIFATADCLELKINEEALKKISEFISIYMYIDKRDRRQFDNPAGFWSTNTVNNTDNVSNKIITFCDMPAGLLMELITFSNSYNIKPLLDLLCYKTARILQETKYDDIVSKFSLQ